MDFFAIDFETANARQDSICQIGLAQVQDGKVINSFSQLIDPDDYFDFINISIHGISEIDVFDQPTFPEFFDEWTEQLSGHILISHTAFDRVAMTRACTKHGLICPDVKWMDSARMVRRAWPEHFAKKGYGLKNVTEHLGINFRHHDAGEDARAAAEVTLRVIDHTGIELDAWAQRVNTPIIELMEETHEVNIDGPFYGSVLVFTGALDIPRREATAIAMHLGFSVGKTVSNKTDLLVVGDQDATKLAGKNRSSKHIKAENLIIAGQEINILTESDFSELMKVNRDDSFS